VFVICHGEIWMVNYGHVWNGNSWCCWSWWWYRGCDLKCWGCDSPVFTCFDFVAEKELLEWFLHIICSVQEVADWQLTSILVDLLERINYHLSCARFPACFLPFDVLVGVFCLKHSYINNSHKYLNISCISIHMIFLNINFF